MSAIRQTGFTIIEVMLFLAIAAVLVTATLIGWTLTINTQSYRDSARSLATVLQQQYSDTLNVANERGSNLTCRVDNEMTTIEPGVGSPRGQSDCVVLGRFVEINGVNIAMYDVVGTEPDAAPDAGDTEDEIIGSYYPGVMKQSRQDYQIAWQARPYVSNEDGSTMRRNIAIIRSPQTGTLQTYSAVGDRTIQELIDNSESRSQVKVCLDPGAPVAQGRAAVFIGANASSSDAISVKTDGDAGC